MANKVVIDVEARFNDNVSPGAKKAAQNIDDIGDAARQAQKEVDKATKKKNKWTFDADNSKFLNKVREAEKKAKAFGRTKTAATLRAVDKATTVMAKVIAKARSISGKVWSGIVSVKDKASEVLSKVSALGKSIASKAWTAVVKVKDLATAPLRKIKDSLFSIKGLIAAVAAGAATQKFVMEPVGLADTIEKSMIAFETKLGSKEAADSFMQDIFKFDEKSPFDTTEIVGITQQMMNLGWTAENVLEDLGTIGDWSASLGKGEEGIGAVTRALGQMRMKGKLSSEEMLQLTEAGVDAWNYVAKFVGKDIATVREMAEDGLIDVDTAIRGIMAGMSEYAGSAAATADRTVSGLKDQIGSLFKTYVALPWGQGLSEGFRDALTQVRDVIDENKDSLKAFGEQMKTVGKVISGWFADRVENVVKRFKDITGSKAFQKGSLTKKINMLWDGVIANPFAGWWSSTVVPWWDGTAMPWLADKFQSIGKGLGKGLTNGILAILGVDLDGAAEDGASLAGSFVEGFKEGFDLSSIGESLKQWMKDNPLLASGIGLFLGGKLLSGLGGAVSNIKGLFGGGSAGGGTLLGGDYSAATMTVNAAVVNINGGLGGGGTPGVPGLPGNQTAPGLPAGAGNTAKIGLWGRISGWGSAAAAKLAGVGTTLGSGAATTAGAAAVGGGSILGGIAGAAGIIDGAVDLYRGTKTKGKESKDNYFKGGTKLGMVGAGAAAGAAIGSVVPVVGTAAGALIGAGVGGIGALFGGDKAGKALSDSTDEGGALNKAWKSTKEFFTDTIPEKWDEAKSKTSNWFKKKYYGDAYDEETGQVDMGWIGETGGWIDKVNALKTFFTESLPGAMEKAGEKISEFFTETIPEKWGEFWDGVGTFFTETIPNAMDSVGEAISKFFTETLPEKWNGFWDEVNAFFLETVPYAVGFVIGKAYAFFTETVPNFFSDLWDSVSTFFTETLPEWAEGIWNDHIYPFFTETIPGFFAGLWSSISTFFTETLPEWAEGIWNEHIYPFFTETIPTFFSSLWSSITTFFTETLPEWAESIWSGHILPFFTETIPTFFSNLWSSITTFFTETLPEWAENIWNNNVLPFFTETIPGFFSSLWSSISTFFTETLPEWAENIWSGHVLPFFTETIPGFFSSLWSSVTTFFNDAIDSIAENIWSPIKTFFTETIPGWIGGVIEKAKSLFGSIKDSFLSGFSAGSGGGEGGGKKARGGIIGGDSSMEAFARGGRTDGGVIGGSTRWIRVNEESPEMIIPLSSQRRDRAMKLWAKTGEMIGAPGFARGGMTNGDTDAGIRHGYYGSDEPAGGQMVNVDVGGVNVEIHVDATGKENIVDAIRAQGGEIAEAVAGILADAFSAQFANTPARGGVA